MNNLVEQTNTAADLIKAVRLSCKFKGTDLSGYFYFPNKYCLLSEIAEMRDQLGWYLSQTIFNITLDFNVPGFLGFETYNYINKQIKPLNEKLKNEKALAQTAYEYLDHLLDCLHDEDEDGVLNAFKEGLIESVVKK